LPRNGVPSEHRRGTVAWIQSEIEAKPRYNGAFIVIVQVVARRDERHSKRAVSPGPLF
jgi:hypothetical protein